jgi:hypothetical protein
VAEKWPNGRKSGHPDSGLGRRTKREKGGIAFTISHRCTEGLLNQDRSLMRSDGS